MNIVHVNVADQARGAARAAFRLHQAQAALGHASRMVVGYRKEPRPDVAMLPVRDTVWQQRLFHRVIRLEEATGLQYLLQPWRGQFLRHPFVREADVINLHNIHGSYFSHLLLPALGRRAPLVWTLHDLWSMSGHCTYPSLYDCERWRVGCGACPALHDYPAIARDTTALLWRLKRRVYGRSAITVVTPSRWLAALARESPLFSTSEVHCIPHGIDTEVFVPRSKKEARHALGLPADARIVLFSAYDLLHRRKGGRYVLEALDRIAEAGVRDLLLLTVGAERISLDHEVRVPVRNLGRIVEEPRMSLCYSAADLLVGPSLAETFGLVFIEAMACGTPVAAFTGTAASEVVVPEETGYLARLRDVADLAQGITRILTDDALRIRLGRRAREIAERDYSVWRQARHYIELYERLRERRMARPLS